MEYIIVHNKKSNKKYKVLLTKEYVVDQSINIPADFFSFLLPNIEGQITDKFSAGDEVHFYINDKLALNGIIDDFELTYDSKTNDININGRDKMSLLLDNDAMPDNLYRLNLKQYLEKKVAPYGFSKFEVDNSDIIDKLPITPGSNEFSIIESICKDKNIYPRYEADTLKCTKLRSDTNADYFFSNEVYRFNNLIGIKFKKLKATVSSDIKNEIVVFGGHYSRGEFTNKNNIKSVVKDETLKVNKRKVINDDDLESNTQATNLAKKELNNYNRDAFTIELELTTTIPIFINKVAKISIPSIGLDAFMLVTKVQYIKNITSGSITNVTLKLIDGVKVDWRNHNIPLLPKV